MCGRLAEIPAQNREIPGAARLLALEALVRELLPDGSLTPEQLLNVNRRIRSGGHYELADELAGSLNSLQLDALEYLRTLTP
jgi:hypothetical protein